MTTACQSANLRALLQLDGICSVVKEFINVYENLNNENRRGTRLRDTMFGDETERREATVKELKSTRSLDSLELRALLSLLNAEHGR